MSLLAAIRRVLRRPPAHLNGRMPAECGPGAASPTHFLGLSRIEGLSRADPLGHLQMNLAQLRAGLPPRSAEEFEQALRWEADEKALTARRQERLRAQTEQAAAILRHAQARAAEAASRGLASVAVRPDEYTAMLFDTLAERRYASPVRFGAGALTCFGVRVEVGK